MGHIELNISQPTGLRAQFERQFSVKTKEPLPTWLLVVFFGILVALFWGAIGSMNSLPKPIYRKDVPANSTSFIAENAMDYIRHLSVEIGVRFQGTANSEYRTVNYLMAKLEEIKKEANPNLIVEINLQISDGGYFRPSSNEYSTINIYRSVQNVVARVTPLDDTSDHILLNSHFDTVPFSPGAGDDGTMVGVMLELFRIISQNGDLKHGVVFLFNGCEENSLQGSHSFISNHNWFNKVKILLNLEVSGAGGKELLFQASEEHPWLMNLYHKSAPSLFASALAEEFFQAGIFPSDTDYRNFRAFGNKLAAMDFAQIQQGRLYHTAGDVFESIDIRSVQHTGNNILAILRALDGSKELANVSEYINEELEARFIFFDVLGLFMVIYNLIIGNATNAMIIVALIFLFLWCSYNIKRIEDVSTCDILKEFSLVLVVHILSVALGVGVVCLIAVIYDFSDRTMTYYANYYIIAGLYFAPFFFTYSVLPYAYIKFRERKERIATSYFVQLALNAHGVVLILILIVLTGIGIRSAFLLVPSCLFYIFTLLINLVFKLHYKGNIWIYVHCLGQVIPCLFLYYVACIAFVNFIPMNARRYSGGATNPDLIVALLAAVFGYLIAGFYGPIMCMFKHRKWILFGYLSIFLVFVIISITPEGFPYREKIAPQRFTIWHAKRLFIDYNYATRKADSGIYIHVYDRHGWTSVKDIVPAINEGHDISEDCRREMYCGIPWYQGRYHGAADYGLWIPASMPPLPRDPSLIRYINRLPGNRWRYTFVMSGPPHMSVQFSPLRGVRVIEWSVVDPMPVATYRWNDRDVYFVNYFMGGLDNSFRFYEFGLVIEVPEAWPEPYFFDIALSGHFIHQPALHNQEFRQFLSEFPAWTNVQAWISYYVSYQVGNHSANSTPPPAVQPYNQGFMV